MFTFASTPKVIFGSGKIKLLTRLLESYGSSVLIVTGRNSFVESDHWGQLLLQFEDARISWKHYMIEREPTPEMIDRCVEGYLAYDIDVVVAIGGGSVIDAGKAISAMLKQDGDIKMYLEGIGSRTPSGKKVPFIAVPTTSGTGSEATKNAVISEVGDNGFKKSLRHDNYVPNIALIDPELTLQCPKPITIQSGMDAFTQLLESYLSTNASKMTDALAIDALRVIREALPAVVKDGNDLKARENMSYAAFISGITLANAGLGVVHGFASSVGGMYDIPHGFVCGSLMGPANRITVRALRATNTNKVALAKYARVGKIFSGKENKPDDYYIDALLDVIDAWTKEYGLDSMKKFGIKPGKVSKILRKTDSKNNPVVLMDEELAEIINQRL